MIVATILAAVIAVLGGPLLAGLLHRRKARRRRQWERRMPATVGRFADECEVCRAPATHELRETLTPTGDVPATWGGGTEMVASYCAEHAPPDAVALPA